ncbi:MAG TPA: hypothetical protein DCL08_04865 [Anaerolineaceae bacterium]|nr:hypothetical protein [Anaerolineaceae bacterium]
MRICNYFPISLLPNLIPNSEIASCLAMTGKCYELPTTSYQLSAFSFELSAFSFELSAFSFICHFRQKIAPFSPLLTA